MSEVFTKDYLSKIIMLEKKIGAKASYKILEPFLLNSRDILAIQNAGKKIAEFIGLNDLTFIIAKVKQEDKVAGRVELDYGKRDVFIEIAEEATEYGEVILATLAHEITHKYMHMNGITCGVGVVHDYDNEVLTDICSVFLGFGKLMLNGYEVEKTYTEGDNLVTERYKGGYLDLDQLAFVYRLVCAMRNVSNEVVLSNLSKNALSSVRSCKKYYKDYFDNKYHTEEFRDEIVKTLEGDIKNLQVVLNQTNQLVESIQNNYINKVKGVMEGKNKTIISLQNYIKSVNQDNIYDPCLRFLEAINFKSRGNQKSVEISQNISEINRLRKKLTKLEKKLNKLG